MSAPRRTADVQWRDSLNQAAPGNRVVDIAQTGQYSAMERQSATNPGDQVGPVLDALEDAGDGVGEVVGAPAARWVIFPLRFAQTPSAGFSSLA
jgi:hypothetical protein